MWPSSSSQVTSLAETMLSSLELRLTKFFHGLKNRFIMLFARFPSPLIFLRRSSLSSQLMYSNSRP